MSSLENLKNNRKYVRGKVTRRCNVVEDNILSYNYDECKSNLDYIKQFTAKLLELDEQIGTLLYSAGKDTDITAEEVETDRYEQLAGRVTISLNQKMGEFSGTQQVQQVQGLQRSNHNSGATSGPSKMKLPEMPLPTYGRLEGESLIKFFNKL